jgi:hypothetical protein
VLSVPGSCKAASIETTGVVVPVATSIWFAVPLTFVTVPAPPPPPRLAAIVDALIETTVVVPTNVDILIRTAVYPETAARQVVTVVAALVVTVVVLFDGVTLNVDQEVLAALMPAGSTVASNVIVLPLAFARIAKAIAPTAGFLLPAGYATPTTRQAPTVVQAPVSEAESVALTACAFAM